MRHRHLGPLDHLVGALLGVAYVIVLVVTAPDIGMSRDEGFYVRAADSYGGWIEHVGRRWTCDVAEGGLGRCAVTCAEGQSCPGGAACPADGQCRSPVAMECGAPGDCSSARRELVDHYWAYNHEHPSLIKGMFALFQLLQTRTEIFVPPSTAYRFFGMVTAGLLLWLIYVFGAQAYSRQVGAFAALAFALMPRVFYHAHLDCFDVPIALMALLVTYAYWRSLTDLRWVVLVGIAYGLALATKHNAWTFPLIYLVHFAFVVLSERRRRRRGEGRRIGLGPWWLLGMALLGPPIFVGLWPWLWYDTLARFREYGAFHLNHEHYNMAYFGVNYFRPPLPASFPWVMLAITVPTTTVALALAGIGTRLHALLPFHLEERWWPDGRAELDAARTDVLLFGCLLAPLVVISLPSTPIFGGTKHWFTAYPFLAIFAGVGFVGAARALRRRLGGRVPFARYAVRVGLAAVLLTPAALETIHSHPFGLSHYGSLAAGGAPGAADLGMNRQFWGFTTGSLTSWLNAHLPEGGSVYVCDTTPTAFRMLQEDGRLDRRIRAQPSLVGADYALVHHEHHFVEVDYQIWEAYGTTQPQLVLTYDGVPIISVYRNPRGRGLPDD
jgi:hypothetical protein